MGLSAGTFVAAKAITSTQVESKEVLKPTLEEVRKAAPSETPKSVTNPGMAALFLDDGGVLDTSKIQLVAWTILGVGTYLLSLGDAIAASATPALPDINPALMALMGLGQGAYLGKKLVTKDTPTLTGLSVREGDATHPTRVTLIGNAFGADQSGSQISFNGVPIVATNVTWGDKEIQFDMPPRREDGQPWRAGDKVEVGLVIGGRSSANTVPLAASAATADRLAPLQVTTVSPLRGPVGSRIKIEGRGFGASQGTSAVTLDSDDLPREVVRVWRDDQVIFHLPDRINGAALSPGAKSVGIRLESGWKIVDAQLDVLPSQGRP
jgi:hypothetical protein